MKILILNDHPGLQELFLPICLEAQKQQVPFQVLIGSYATNFTWGYDRFGIPWSDDICSFMSAISSGRPDSVLLTGADMQFSPAHDLGREMVRLAKENGVPSISVQHGPTLTCAENPDIIFNSDVAVLASLNDVNIYRSLEVEPSRLFLTGFPAYDSYRYRPRNHAAPILIASSINGIAPLLPIEDVINHYVEVLSRVHEAFLYHSFLVRPHPGDIRDGSVSYYGDIFNQVPVSTFPSLRMTLAEDISNSSYVVSFSPSVVFHAIALGRRAMYCGTYHEPTLEIMKEAGVLIWPCSISEIARDFDSPLDYRREFIENYFYRFDGGASKRVLEVARGLLKSA